MQAAPTALLGTDPSLASLPAMERFSKRKRHHAPLGKLIAQADDLRQMGRDISNCANALEVLLELPEGGDPFAMLTDYNPCNRRACPMCEWRRSQVWRARLMSGLDCFFAEHPTHKAIFATFTVKNVPLDQLGQTIKDMHKSWDRLTKLSMFPSPFWFRRTEVTVKRLHGQREGIPPNLIPPTAQPTLGGFDDHGVEPIEAEPVAGGWGPVMAHPHIHSLIMVPASYWSQNYVKLSTWQKAWMMSARLDYAPVVDIRAARAKCTTGEAFYDARAAGIEAMKYAVKATDMLKLTADLPEFVRQMRGHRLVGMSSKLAAYVPEHDPTAKEMSDDREAGLPSLHPGVACMALWDAAVGSYVLTPRA